MTQWKWMAGLLVFWTFGCGLSDRAAEPENTLHYYQFSLPRDREAFDKLKNLFALGHPEINVEIHTLPTTSDDQHQYYLTHIASAEESRIDVFALDVIWLAEFARAGLLMPLGELFGESEWEAFFPSSVQAATYRGDRYAVPLFVDGGMLYFRRDLLEKYGYPSPPKTWDGLVGMARDIVEQEHDPALRGFVWQGKQYEGLICNFMEYFSEGDSLQGTGRASMDWSQKPVRDALRFMRDLVFTHQVSPQSVFSMSEEESRHVFHNGHAVFMRNWPYAWRLAQREGSPVAGKIGVSPLPAMIAGEKGRGTLGGFLVGINRHTPWPAAARAWVRFLAGPEAQKVLWDQLGLTPARKSVFPELGDRGFPMEVLVQVMDSTRPRPVTPVYTPVSQSLQSYISGALVGAYSIDRAVRLMESDSRRLLHILDG